MLWRDSSDFNREGKSCGEIVVILIEMVRVVEI